MSNSKLFICYSVPLMRELTKNGCRYELVGLHPSYPHNKFWVFIKTENVIGILNAWGSK